MPRQPKWLRTQSSSSVVTAPGHSSRVRLSPLAFRWRQRSLAGLLCAGGTRENRTSIRDGNRLNACCHESAYHSYHQNRDSDCQLCIHLYLHCVAPLGDLGFVSLARAYPSQVPLLMQPAYQTGNVDVRVRSTVNLTETKGKL